MTKARWKRSILQQMATLGLQNDGYSPMIETLADILEQRDRTYKEFLDGGGRSVIEYTNKGGSTNPSKNPALTLWDTLNGRALEYWRELGLTPSSFRKMTGETPKEEKRSALAAALETLERD